MRTPVAVWNRSRPSQDNEILLPPGTGFRVVRRHAEGGLRCITTQHVTARDIAAEHAQLSPASASRWQRSSRVGLRLEWDDADDGGRAHTDSRVKCTAKCRASVSCHSFIYSQSFALASSSVLVPPIHQSFDDITDENGR